MDILFIHFEYRVREILAFALESRFQTKVVHVANLAEAIPLLEKKPRLVIYSFTEERDDHFKKFIKNKVNTPSLLITNDVPTEVDNTLDKDLLACVSQIDLLDNLCVEVEKLVHANKVSFSLLAEVEEAKDFCQIRTQLLIEASPLKADIYIRLSNTRFVKIFSQGDSFDANDLEKYFLKKKVEYFWLKKNDIGIFTKKYSDLLDKLTASPTTTIQDIKKATISANEALHELSSQLGFTDEVKSLVKSNMQLAVKAMQTTPGLSGLLTKFDKEKDKYIPMHSTIVAFLACALSREMSWGSEATFQKLTMAAFLHDITLQNHDLALVKDLKELSMIKGFTAEEIRAFEMHPLQASEIVRGIPAAPADVDTIILQHHETHDGKGFPRKLNATHISPMSSVFIIAHEIVDASMTGTPLVPFIEELKAKYTTGNFKKIMREVNFEKLQK